MKMQMKKEQHQTNLTSSIMYKHGYFHQEAIQNERESEKVLCMKTDSHWVCALIALME